MGVAAAADGMTTPVNDELILPGRELSLRVQCIKANAKHQNAQKLRDPQPFLAKS
jgi:hypothetical protein